MSDLRVNVKDTEVSTFEGISTKGKPYKITKQENIFLDINGEIRKFPITLESNSSPYASGLYTFDPVSILEVGKFGLEIAKFKAIKLQPYQPSK
jgi:hypothetical protein